MNIKVICVHFQTWKNVWNDPMKRIITMLNDEVYLTHGWTIIHKPGIEKCEYNEWCWTMNPFITRTKIKQLGGYEQRTECKSYENGQSEK